MKFKGKYDEMKEIEDSFCIKLIDSFTVTATIGERDLPTVRSDIVAFDSFSAV